MGRGILIPWCYHSPTTSGWKRTPWATPGGLCLLRWQEWTATPMGHSVRQKDGKKKKGNRKIMHLNMLPRDSNTYLSLMVASVTPSLTALYRKVFSQWALSVSVCIRVATGCGCNIGPASASLYAPLDPKQHLNNPDASSATRLHRHRHAIINARCRVLIRTPSVKLRRRTIRRQKEPQS